MFFIEILCNRSVNAQSLSLGGIFNPAMNRRVHGNILDFGVLVCSVFKFFTLCHERVVN
jgi:hypothetical protein